MDRKRKILNDTRKVMMVYLATVERYSKVRKERLKFGHKF
jgi:hypothetical protein